MIYMTEVPFFLNLWPADDGESYRLARALHDALVGDRLTVHHGPTTRLDRLISMNDLLVHSMVVVDFAEETTPQVLAWRTTAAGEWNLVDRQLVQQAFTAYQALAAQGSATPTGEVVVPGQSSLAVFVHGYWNGVYIGFALYQEGLAPQDGLRQLEHVFANFHPERSMGGVT